MNKKMTKKTTGTNHIVMSFAAAPSNEDMMALALDILENLPSDFEKYLGSFTCEIEEFPDIDIEEELELESPYDQLAYFKAKALSVGKVPSKGEAGVLMLYRRSILDYWCESEAELVPLLHEVIYTELGGHCDFSDAEIEDLLDSVL